MLGLTEALIQSQTVQEDLKGLINLTHLLQDLGLTVIDLGREGGTKQGLSILSLSLHMNTMWITRF